MLSQLMLKRLRIVVFLGLVVIALLHVSHIATGGERFHFMEAGTFAVISLIPLGLIYRTNRRNRK